MARRSQRGQQFLKLLVIGALMVIVRSVLHNLHQYKPASLTKLPKARSYRAAPAAISSLPSVGKPVTSRSDSKLSIKSMFTAQHRGNTRMGHEMSGPTKVELKDLKGQWPEENVWDYPRPPALELINRHLRVVWVDAAGKETIIADSTRAYRVLETSHPPTFYFPPEDIVEPDRLKKTARSTYCEWKGMATYYSFVPPTSSDDTSTKTNQRQQIVENRIWAYDSPTSGFEPIKGYLSFYASAWPGGGQVSAGDDRGGWRCEVDGEVVKPQQSDFYGGWVHKGIIGKMKGPRGTEYW